MVRNLILSAGLLFVVGGAHIAHAGLFLRAFATTSMITDSIPVLQAPSMLAIISGIGGPTMEMDENVMVADDAVWSDDNIVIPEVSDITTYTVQNGDTLMEIAQKFKISTNTIRWANGLGAKGTIKVGQELVILPVTGVKHKIVRGDTVASLAKKYRSDAADIADFNGIETTDKLIVGETLIIPDGDGSIIEEKSSKSKSKPGIKKPGDSGTVSASGYFIRPVRGIKTQGFHGPYNAVDIGAPEGTPIVAAADGVVIVAKQGWNGGYGVLTIIKHANGSQSLYAHQSRITVSVGQSVKQGQQIGAVGHTGHVIGVTGNHLHLEFRGIKTPILY